MKETAIVERRFEKAVVAGICTVKECIVFEKHSIERIFVTYRSMTEQWAPLCRKYACTMTQLVIGWTAAQGNGGNVNVLCGARKAYQIEDNAKGGDVALDAADIAAMRHDVEAISG